MVFKPQFFSHPAFSSFFFLSNLPLLFDIPWKLMFEKKVHRLERERLINHQTPLHAWWAASWSLGTFFCPLSINFRQILQIDLRSNKKIYYQTVTPVLEHRPQASFKRGKEPVPDICLAPALQSVDQDEAGPAQSPLIRRWAFSHLTTLSAPLMWCSWALGTHILPWRCRSSPAQPQPGPGINEIKHLKSSSSKNIKHY